jgi:PhoPQ-activated pathogenicity-related protein
MLENRIVPSSSGQTALDAYVAAPDPAYAYSLNSTLSGPGYTDYVINMTSQTWRSPAEVSPSTWQHWLQVIVPSTVKSQTGVLQIGGGSNSASPPTSADGTGVQTATTLGAITTVLPTVPNEPLQFAGQTSSFTEDQIIAYSFEQYLGGGDQNWPALLPMVKSAVKAMDTTQSFVTAESGGSLQVNNFIVTGASKRGWTTWLTPAVDSRVVGIVPFVFDFLNNAEQIPNLKDTYVGVTQHIVGGYPDAVQDYTNDGVFASNGTPQGQALQQIVDPFNYIGRSTYNIPKYLINSTGDQFFVPDSAQFYFSALPGQNYLRYVPNTDHGLNGSAVNGAINFEKVLIDGAHLPQFSWTVANAGTTIDLHTIDTPASVTMWQATNPTNRDFRLEDFGPNWTSSPLTDQGGGNYAASVSIPATGATAFFIEMTYNVDGVTLTFTTQISTVPLFTPSVAVADASGTYNGQPFAATASATGVSGSPVPGAFTYTYYTGSTSTGTGTSTPPTKADTYTVVASFASSDPAYLNGQSAPLTFTISPFQVTGGVLTIYGDGSSTIHVGLSDSGALDVSVNGIAQHYDPGTVTSIIVSGAGGSDSLTVDDTGTASGQIYTLTSTELDRSGAQPITYSNIPTLVLNAGNFGNAIDWQSTSSATTVYTGTGANAINFGDTNNTLDGFHGTPVLQGQGSSNTVNVHDQGSTASHTYVITANSLTRDGGTGYGYGTGYVAVNYYLGSGGNTIDWQGTGAPTTVYTGAGTNTINFGDADNTLDGFCDTPILQGQGSSNTVNIYDQGSTAAHTYVITGSSLTRDGGTGYGYDLQTVNFHFGSGGNTIDWQGDAYGETDTVYSGTGANTINFGDSNNTLNSFDGTPILQGQGGNNTVNVYDQGTTAARHYVITGNSLSINGGQSFGYGYNFQAASVYLGSGGNTVDWQGTSAPTTVYSGTGTNTINFGDANNTLDSFAGTPVLQGQGSSNTVNVYDQGSTAPHTYVITGTSLTRDGGTGYAYDVQAVNYHFGTGSNSVNWQATTSAATAYTADFGGGGDQVQGAYSATATNVNAAVSMTGSVPSLGALTVTTQGSLDLSQAAGGPVTATSVNNQGGIAGSGHLALADAGDFTSGNLILVLGGTTAGTSYDQIQVGGTASLSGSLALSLVQGFVPTPGSTFTIVHDTAGTPVGGSFTGLPDGTLIHVNGVDAGNQPFSTLFQIHYSGGDVVLTNVAAPQVSADNATVTVTAGSTASNTGTWSQVGFAGADSISASVGSISQTGSAGSGTWSWTFPTSMTSQSQTVTITADDGQGDTATTTFMLVVSPIATTTALQPSINPSFHGQSITFTATVSPASADSVAPTGVVTFLDGSTTLGTASLSGNVATFTTSGLATGSHSVTASYGGDANYVASTSAAVAQTVKAFGSNTTVTSSVNPSVFGQRVTFTATVKASSGSLTPSGTVTFLDGTTTLGTATLSSGKATFSTATLAVASHAITVSYGGDSNFTGSTSGVLTQVVNQAATTSKVTASANPSVFGQTVTFTATVTAKSPGAGTPTGTVTFLDGTTTLATGTLSGGKATFSTSGLAVGGHSLTVSYAGDSSFTGSTSPTLTETVNPDSTTTKVTSSANPSVFGQTVTFTATVTARTPGSGTPAGTATFLDGSTVLATVPLSGGQATYSTSTLSVASHSITVQFTDGDGNFTGSTSSVLRQAVQQASTTTTLTSSLNPSAFGSAVTFTATVTANSPGSGTPAGSVTFKDGSRTLATVTLNSSGQATFSTSSLAVGNHTISAAYGGSTSYKSSSASLTQVVNPANSSNAVGPARTLPATPEAATAQAGVAGANQAPALDISTADPALMMAVLLALGGEPQALLSAPNLDTPANSPSAAAADATAASQLTAAYGYRKAAGNSSIVDGEA